DWQPARLNRRQALTLIGAGAGGAAFFPELLAQKQPTFPKGAGIRTLFKDVSPESISAPIRFHEHLSIDLRPYLNPRRTTAQPPPTSNVDLIVDEVKLAAKGGVVMIVDGGHPDMKRRIETLKEVANRTGMLVVASGGYYMERVYPPELAKLSEDQIADGLVR